ncbi:MAG: S9 family peptidase [Candidatus Cloacimonetes bacterium]|nr:S9 family peptidase [Candidatus Cloacimonadota bacterium]
MKKLMFLFLNLIALSVVFAAPKPPVALEFPQRKEMHGVKWIDNYDYMSKIESRANTLNYIRSENKYSKRVGRSFSRLQKEIFKEIKGRIREDDLSVPYKIRDWQYYYEEKKGLAYGVNYRVNVVTQERQILLDSNLLAKGQKYFDIGEYAISPNDSILAYTVDYEGSEAYTLKLKDIDMGLHYAESYKNVGSVVWFNDSKSFLYTVESDGGLPNQLYFHTLGTDPTKDKLLFEEEDDAFYLYLSKSRSEEYIFINSSSKTSSESWYISANEPNGEIKLLHARRDNIKAFPAHYGDKFYMLTNEFEPNYQYYEVVEEDFGQLRMIFSGSDNRVINGVSHFKNYLVLSERINGQSRIRIVNKNTNNQFYIDFPNAYFAVDLDYNPDSEIDSLRFTYDSMAEPSILYQANMADLEHNEKDSKIVLKQYSPRGAFDKSQYEEKLELVDIGGGQKVAVMLVYKKDLFTGNNPCLLTAYGSYGDSEDPYFSISRLSLLDRGWIYAIAQVRGGGELGQSWHDQGRLLNRKNTFNDFIACSEYLINEGYTSPEKLAIEGGSAGGMLIGAVLNQRPELYRSAIADVPFVDVLNTMLDCSQTLTVTEYDEWGDPKEKEYFDYIYSYAPYEQVKAQDYPHILITAGFRDTRVPYWEPLKWAAKLRKMKTDKHVLLLKMNMNEGHNRSGDRYSAIKETAFSYAFLIWTIERERFE